MKKFTIAITALAALIAFSSPLFAEDGKMMFGVKGGLNLANLSGDELVDNSMKIGFAGGVFMCYSFTEIFAIQPELLFSMKGAKWGKNDEDLALNYFEIPLLFKVNLPTEGKMKPSLYAGPVLGILMSAKYNDKDEKELWKSTDIGIIAGAGLGYQIEKGMFSFEFRYEVSMSANDDFDNVKLSTLGLTKSPEIRNNVMSLFVGYGFSF